MKRVMTVVAGLLVVLTVATTAGNGAEAQDGAGATIEAQETQIAELEATVDARGDKINAQRTQIAELKALLPVVNEDPAIGDVFALLDFEFTLQGTELVESVGSFDPQRPTGIYLVVNLDVRNVSDNPVAFPYDEFRVEDGRGRSYSYDSTGTIYLLSDVFDLLSPFEPLQPDLIYSTAVVFDVPVESTGFTLSTSRNDFEAPLDR